MLLRVESSNTPMSFFFHLCLSLNALRVHGILGINKQVSSIIWSLKCASCKNNAKILASMFRIRVISAALPELQSRQIF